MLPRRRGRTDRGPAQEVRRGHGPLGLGYPTGAALTDSLGRLRAHGLAIARAAIAGADPAAAVERALDARSIEVAPDGRFACVAAGKAAVAMVRAWLGRTDRARGGVVVMAPECGPSWPAGVQTFDAGHPTPTSDSARGARAALALARSLSDHDTLLVLLSGGASSLMAGPAPPLTVDDKVAVTRLLLRAGASIDQLNCVRRHLSCIKGGQLAAACRGRIETLAISDVCLPVQDDPCVIGSGPTAPDPSTFQDALTVVDQAAIEEAMPPAALERLRAGAAGQLEDTLKPGSPALSRASFRVVASRRDAMAGARNAASALGYLTMVVDAPVVGEARVAGPAFVEAALLEAALRHSSGAPLCVIASGETTVAVRGTGRGGRNQELVLATAERLAGAGRHSLLLSVGTDGIDGPTDAAGAVADSSTLARAAAIGLAAPREWLDRNDSYRFFSALGDLVTTGATGTNVGDLQVLLLA